MGLTCSVLGHQFGERERSESRDEQGSEVIVTIQEIETCIRCGHEKVVTESKEVTAAHGGSNHEPPSDPVPDPTPVDEAAPEVSELNADDGVILTDEEDRDPGEWPPIETDEKPASPGDEPAWPAVDDPETDQSASEETAAWPKAHAEDHGFDAVAGEDESVYADEVIEPTPRSDESIAETTEGTGFARAGPIASPHDPPAADVHIEYYCPRCSWTARSLTTSVRAGDICPGCRAGYVAERDD